MILKAAVEDNVDTAHGRLPKRLHRRRQPLRRGLATAWVGTLALALMLATARIPRGRASASSAARVAVEPARPLTNPRPVLPATPFQAQPVSPQVLALGVRRVI